MSGAKTVKGFTATGAKIAMARGTSAAEAENLKAAYRRPEGLLHPVMVYITAKWARCVPFSGESIKGTDGRSALWSKNCWLAVSRFDGKLLVVAGVSGFAFVEGQHQLAIGPRANASKQVVHGGKASSAEQPIALNHLQVMDGLFKSGVEFSNGVVNVGFDGYQFGG
jgi:hypothetical protein